MVFANLFHDSSKINRLPLFCKLEKTGVVKEDAFFTILKLHGVDLADGEKNRLKKSFSRAGKINF